MTSAVKTGFALGPVFGFHKESFLVVPLRFENLEASKIKGKTKKGGKVHES